jgi:hypothetical protein
MESQSISWRFKPIYRAYRLLFFSLSLATLSLTLAHAQEPTSFEIRIILKREYAVSGQPFTYNIVITNTGGNLKDVL